MTIRQVAQIAGVSTATVSRVLNSSPYIAEATAEAVRRAIEEVQYRPTRKRRGALRAAEAAETPPKVGLYVIERTQNSHNPAYERILRGVADAAAELKFDLKFGFVQSGEQSALDKLEALNFDGLLLHGIPPTGLSQRLQSLPTVWLLGGRTRPTWGDQIMPDNDSIGRIAANYLLENGRRDLMYMGVDSAWFFQVRASAFQRAVEEGGGTVLDVRHIPGTPTGPNRAEFGEMFLAAWKRLKKKPTGLFVAEDWLLSPIYEAAAMAGIKIGTDLLVISCNNDRIRLEGLSPQPATIDVHFDRAAFRGAQLLMYRLRSKSLSDRMRILLEPTLVLP